MKASTKILDITPNNFLNSKNYIFYLLFINHTIFNLKINEIVMIVNIWINIFTIKFNYIIFNYIFNYMFNYKIIH